MKNYRKNRMKIEKLLQVIRPRLTTLAEAKYLLDYVIGDLPNPDYNFKELFQKDDNLNNKNSLSILRELLKHLNKLNSDAFNEENIDKIVLEVAANYNLKRANILWLLRLVVSSKLVALPIYESMVAIGKTTVQKRIRFAINKLQESNNG